MKIKTSFRNKLHKATYVAKLYQRVNNWERKWLENTYGEYIPKAKYHIV